MLFEKKLIHHKGIRSPFMFINKFISMKTIKRPQAESCDVTWRIHCLQKRVIIWLCGYGLLVLFWSRSLGVTVFLKIFIKVKIGKFRRAQRYWHRKISFHLFLLTIIISRDVMSDIIFSDSFLWLCSFVFFLFFALFKIK